MIEFDSIIEEIERADAVLVKVSEICPGADELAGALRDREIFAQHIDRAPVHSKESLLHAVYQGLRLPGYFGFTWDSLKDVLADFDSGENKLAALVFQNLDLLPGEDLECFLEVVKDANELRGGETGRVGFRVLTFD